MLRNMACSLITHEAIRTTLPKAKELRRVVEPLITLAKEPTVANKRLAFNRLRDRDVVVKLFNQVGPRFANRQGGYTRILKMGFRNGDNAPMAYMELVEHAVAVEEVPAAEEAKAELCRSIPREVFVFPTQKPRPVERHCPAAGLSLSRGAHHG